MSRKGKPKAWLRRIKRARAGIGSVLRHMRRLASMRRSQLE